MTTDEIMKLADAYADKNVKLSNSMYLSTMSQRTKDAFKEVTKARAALLKAVEALVADAERYRWLREHKAMWSWNPAHYKEGLISGFAHANTGYLGFDFESALKDAMKKKTP